MKRMASLNRIWCAYKANSGSRHAKGLAVVCGCIALVLTFYLWLGSLGTWTRWPQSTNWYGQLASAFLHGQISLLQQPDSDLLALSDPYNPSQLANVPYPLDYSLYEGKFYFYVGPVPALLLAPA